MKDRNTTYCLLLNILHIAINWTINVTIKVKANRSNKNENLFTKLYYIGTLNFEEAASR